MQILKSLKSKRASRHPLKVGETAPDFSLLSQEGKTVRLSEFRGKKNIVLYFYPMDDTPGCIVESSAFRDQYAVFREAGAEILGISSDSPTSHVHFASKYQLPFVLLSDKGNSVRKLYKVPPTLGLIPGRVTYLIDKNGIIRHVFSSQFNPKSHVEQSLAALKELEGPVTESK